MSEQKQKNYNELGLGEKTSSGNIRSLNKDGSFNVRKINIPFWERNSFFHSLTTMSWFKFFTVILLGYIIANLFFASLYVLIGVEHLTGINAETTFEKFTEAFFFSAQTISTLGYGRVAPVGMAANIIAAIEAMLGLLSFALATGLLYGRFSKPTARIKYSAHAVISPYHEINGFMFRVINLRQSELFEVEITVTLSLKRENSDLRNFHTLDLERKKIVLFPSVWTVVHPINESSPMYNMTPAESISKDAEIIILIKAFDESFSQTVYSRSSYKANEILWGRKFVYLIQQSDQSFVVDASRIDETENAELNS
ncbi:MAG: K+ channel, inward rectifier [Crocinitomicaceae bacterium]|nr:K+ channel, inward rectifier [Crocinitomicaceae bacterium]